MRRLNNIYSHRELKNKKQKGSLKWKQRSSNSEIISSNALYVANYEELVKKVGRIAFYNRVNTLFYRGQSDDFKEGDKSTCLPTIYRKKEGQDRIQLKKRFEILDTSSSKLREAFRNVSTKWAGTSIATKYQEVRWSLLQHYEILQKTGGTPVLDFTHSLHIACSFAIDDKKDRKYGYVLLFGLPGTNQPINYFVNDEIFIVRLLNFCPPSAYRPFFQEGYCAGHFPLDRLDESSRKDQFDFARRIIAKFIIPNDSTQFFGNSFKKVPDKLLYPEKDEFMYFIKNAVQ